MGLGLGSKSGFCERANVSSCLSVLLDKEPERLPGGMGRCTYVVRFRNEDFDAACSDSDFVNSNVMVDMLFDARKMFWGRIWLDGTW